MNSTIVLLFCIEERLLHLRGRMGILITGETWQRCEKSCKILVFHLFHKIICLIEFSWRSLFHIQLHIALGLGVRHGEATAIVPLTRLRAHFWTFYIKDLVLRLTTMFETWIVLIDYKVIKTQMVDDVSACQPPRPWVDGGERGDEHWLCFSPVGSSWVACESKDCLNNFLGPTQQCRFDFHF